MLAAFDVFTVALSLTLNHQIVKSYSRSIDSNIGWVEVINHAWLVSRLSAAIDAPANNVFESSDVAAESARIQTAAAEFDKMIEAIRSSLNAMAETPQHEALRNNATEALRLKNQMVEQSRQLFDRLSHGQREQAIHNMVSMNQANSSILGLMSEFHNKIRQIRIDEFNRQTGSARWLQGFEWIVGGLMLVMIGFATLWGFRLARRATQEAVRQQRYNQELERQVALRTDELNLAFGRHGDLIRQLISAQEDERSRIARDLHDEIGQSLTSLAIGMRSLDDAQDLYAVHERSGELRRIAVHAADEVRRLARGLRPAVLDDLGLNAALERLASDCEQVHGLTVHLHAAGPVAPRLSGTLETALYRIIQEALNNIVKHAGANQVWIDLDRQPEKITAVVADDGAGIASDSLQRAHHSGRLGVSGMRERATLLGGSLEIRRRSAGGTAVQVVLPLDGGLTGG
jgi:signal transduction histidine kinase